MKYTRDDDQEELVIDEYNQALVEVRVAFGSCDEVLGYVYQNIYEHIWKEFEKVAIAMGGELSDSIVENDDKYETFRGLLNMRNG